MSNQRFRVTWFKKPIEGLPCHARTKGGQPCHAEVAMLTEQIELVNMNEENSFQPYETTATLQKDLLVLDENEEGDRYMFKKYPL